MSVNFKFRNNAGEATARYLVSIRPDIFNADGSPAVGDGPFAPIWQMFPADEASHLVNLNLFSLEDWKAPILDVLNTGNPTWGPILDAGEANVSPVSAFLYPVLSDKNSTEVKAIVVLLSSWDSMLKKEGLSSSPVNLLTVVRDSCQVGVNVTFDLNKGDFQGWNRDTSKHIDASLHSELELASSSCNYTVSFYPSSPSARNHKAFWHAFLTAFGFALAASMFVWYDLLVAKRQKVVLEHAVQSRAIVSSLFPEQVHDRLFRRESLGENGDPSLDEDITQDDSTLVVFEPTKQRLRSFLDHNGDVSMSEGGGMKPIADLFPNCTVLVRQQ